MGKKPVDDFGLEVLRKAAQDSADGTKYDLRSIISTEVNTALNSAQFAETNKLNESILKELKKMNIYLSIICNEEIDNKDV